MKLTVIYVNPVEYHGPHLPLTTDYEISRGLTGALLARLKIKNPAIEITRSIEIHEGCEPAPGPGSVSTSLKDLKQKIKTQCKTLLITEQPDLVLFMTFHGAPKHAAAIQSGVEFFETQGIRVLNPFNFTITRLRDYEPVLAEPVAQFIPDASFALHFIEHLPEDFHGGLFETSVLMKLNPDSVKANHRDLPDCEDRVLSPFWKLAIAFFHGIGFRTFAKELRIGADALGWMTSPKYAGYTGAPRFASPEIGNHFVEMILKDYENGFWQVAEAKALSPKPILQWAIYF